MSISIFSHLTYWCRDHWLVIIGCGNWGDFCPFHSHTYWQVFVESFIPTKLLTGLCHILLSSWSSQQTWLCKVNIPNQLQNSHLNNFCYMRGKWLARVKSSDTSDFHVTSSVAMQHSATDQIWFKELTPKLHWSVLQHLHSFPLMIASFPTSCWLLESEESFEIHTSHPLKES